MDTPSENLVYKVINNSKFEFNGSKLRLLQGLDVDGDGQPSLINLTVSVTDNSTNHNCSATSIVQIKVENVNDNFPRIDTQSCPETISQNFSGALCSVTASDDDLHSYNFTFFLTRSYGIFTIDDSTGNISVPESHTLKANVTYNVSVVVSDHGSPPKMNHSVIEIFVNASNHFCPEFLNASVTVDILDTSYPKSVWNMTATDRDSGPEGEIRYKIIKGDGDLFKINPVTGEIILKKSLNCNHPNTKYILSVKAQDQGFSRMSTTGNVTIRVTNINEKPKIKNINYELCVNLPLMANTTIARVIAEDPYSVCMGNKFDQTLVYTLTDSKGLFHMDNGVISTVESITNGTLNYTLEVTVTNEQRLNDTKPFPISSGKKGEPVFKSSVIEKSIDENTKSSTSILTMEATGNPNISYSIKSVSSQHDAFKINNTTVSTLLHVYISSKDQ